MVDTEIILRTPVRVQDENGVWRDGDVTEHAVLAQVGSVTRSEFFGGGQNGLRPELVFTVFADEYRGEKECAHGGAAYSIYRTFHVPGTDYLELYVQRKAGVVNGA